ncbi:peptidylprolyl isomerase [Psychrobium sp. MM17-31]|uniref:peptidylprolyl isomerase n=1 Tax=Psychrobium sp. MM17-31 TaxID=2917758 RepID=UPI001EF53A46|nr:peptidylprolyl isomerase [Psychrobium sp. MM17-31]
MFRHLFVALIATVTLSTSLHAADKKNQTLDLRQQYRGADILPENGFPQVKLVTSMGDIVVELNRDRAPVTANNFLWLVKNKEYDNTIFHRIIKNFVVQGGGVAPDMTSKPDNYLIVNESGNGLTNDFGTIAMARETEPHSASRQFYFNVNPEGNRNLNPNSRRWGYTVFGEVINGIEVLEQMAQVHVGTDSKKGWDDVPLTKIYLKSATIINP